MNRGVAVHAVNVEWMERKEWMKWIIPTGPPTLRRPRLNGSILYNEPFLQVLLDSANPDWLFQYCIVNLTYRLNIASWFISTGPPLLRRRSQPGPESFNFYTFGRNVFLAWTRTPFWAKVEFPPRREHTTSKNADTLLNSELVVMGRRPARRPLEEALSHCLNISGDGASSHVHRGAAGSTTPAATTGRAHYTAAVCIVGMN